ncbi:hypothetical protein DL93DRAFT_2086821, partial [Clavulina sp. PMI_390]
MDTKRAPDRHRGIVVTGQPGIGKTFFDWYIIQHKCRKGHPILFNYFQEYYLFYDHHVYKPDAKADVDKLKGAILRILEPGSILWCIIDMETALRPPEYLAMNAAWYPIQTTSPNPVRYDQWSRVRTHLTVQ